MIVSGLRYNNRPRRVVSLSDGRCRLAIRAADAQPGLRAAGAARVRLGRQLADHEGGPDPHHAAVVRLRALLAGLAVPVRLPGGDRAAGLADAARPAGAAERGTVADGDLPAAGELR